MAGSRDTKGQYRHVCLQLYGAITKLVGYLQVTTEPDVQLALLHAYPPSDAVGVVSAKTLPTPRTRMNAPPVRAAFDVCSAETIGASNVSDSDRVLGTPRTINPTPRPQHGCLSSQITSVAEVHDVVPHASATRAVAELAP